MDLSLTSINKVHLGACRLLSVCPEGINVKKTIIFHSENMRYVCKFSTAELPLSLAKKSFFVGIFCLTGIIQKEKDKCDLPWLNLQQGQICRAQEKSQPEFNL